MFLSIFTHRHLPFLRRQRWTGNIHKVLINKEIEHFFLVSCILNMFGKRPSLLYKVANYTYTMENTLSMPHITKRSLDEKISGLDYPQLVFSFPPPIPPQKTYILLKLTLDPAERTRPIVRWRARDFPLNIRKRRSIHEEKKSATTDFLLTRGLRQHRSAHLNGPTDFFSPRNEIQRSAPQPHHSRNTACYYGITDIECPFGLSSPSFFRFFFFFFF